jgi:hypothetical protein
LTIVVFSELRINRFAIEMMIFVAGVESPIIYSFQISNSAVGFT